MDLDTDPLYRGASRVVRSPHRRTIVFTITAEPDPAAAPNWDHRFVAQPELGVGIIHDSPWSSQDAWGSLVGATTSEKPRRGGMSTTFPGPLLSVEDLGSWYEAVAQADPTLDIDGPSGIFMGRRGDLWWDGAVAEGWTFWFGRTAILREKTWREIVGLFGSPPTEYDVDRISRFEAAVRNWDDRGQVNTGATQIAPTHLGRPWNDMDWFCEINA
jgi:hypothetical protein